MKFLFVCLLAQLGAAVNKREAKCSLLKDYSFIHNFNCNHFVLNLKI